MPGFRNSESAVPPASCQSFSVGELARQNSLDGSSLWLGAWLKLVGQFRRRTVSTRYRYRTTQPWEHCTFQIVLYRYGYTLTILSLGRMKTNDQRTVVGICFTGTCYPTNRSVRYGTEYEQSGSRHSTVRFIWEEGPTVRCVVCRVEHGTVPKTHCTQRREYQQAITKGLAYPIPPEDHATTNSGWSNTNHKPSARNTDGWSIVTVFDSYSFVLL